MVRFKTDGDLTLLRGEFFSDDFVGDNFGDSSSFDNARPRRAALPGSIFFYLSFFVFFLSFFSCSYFFCYSWWSVFILNLSCNVMNSLMRSSCFDLKKNSILSISSRNACTHWTVCSSDSNFISSSLSGYIFWISFFFSSGTNFVNLAVILLISFWSPN